jgi:hypothetical protein
MGRQTSHTNSSCSAPRASPPNRKNGIVVVFYVLYSKVFQLPPLRFYCVGGCWDRIQDAGIEPKMLGSNPKMLGLNLKMLGSNSRMLGAVVGKMTTFDLWPIPLGGGAWGAGTNMWHPETPASNESLPAPLATQIPTLPTLRKIKYFIFYFFYFVYIHLGEGAWGGLWY